MAMLAPASQAANLSPMQQKVLSALTQSPYQWFASTDPKAENHDYLLLKPGETRRISLTGGALERLWSTASIPDQITLAIENGTKVLLLQDNKAQIGTFFQKAFTLYPQSVMNSPLKTLAKDATLVVTNHAKEANKFFYQVTIRPVSPAPTPLSGQELIINAQKKLDGGEAMTVGDPGQLKGGVIRQIQISASDGTELPLHELLLQIAAGNNTPLVQVPLSAFLGSFAKTPQGKNVLASWDKKTLTINWPMPAGSGPEDELTLKIQNTGQTSCSVKVQLSFLQMTNPPQYLFCARQGSGNSVEGKPFSLATVEGAGALVGISADMGPQPDSPRRTFAFLEGNETISADGNNYEGTGTEDFFNSAWYFPKLTYSHPYDGVSAHSDAPPRVAASRWMIDDPVPFQKKLQVTLEHGNGNRGTDLQYHWYVFWYQTPQAHFDIPDMLHAANGAASGPAAAAPQNSVLAALLRVLLFTAIFAGMVFIVLVALAKFAQKK